MCVRVCAAYHMRSDPEGEQIALPVWTTAAALFFLRLRPRVFALRRTREYRLCIILMNLFFFLLSNLAFQLPKSLQSWTKCGMCSLRCIMLSWKTEKSVPISTRLESIIKIYFASFCLWGYVGVTAKNPFTRGVGKYISGEFQPYFPVLYILWLYFSW